MKFVSGICLITEDVRGLAEFYLRVLSAKTDINDVHVVIPVDGGGITVYSKTAAEADMGFDFSEYSGTGMCKFTFLVRDVDAEYERLKAMEVEVIIPPTTYPWGARSMHFRDPDGNIVCFVNE